MIVPEALTLRKPQTPGITAAAVSVATALEALSQQANFAPTLTAAVGRIASAALLLAKISGAETSVMFSGRGPVRSIGVVASVEALLGIEVENPEADVPIPEKGSFDVPALIGDLGLLTVERAGRSEAIPFVRGGIGEEIAQYLWEIEDKRSLVVLSEVLSPSGVEAAGGLIVVLDDEVGDDTVSRLEASFASFGALSDHLRRRETPEEWLTALLAGVWPRP
ncbi:MAG TPA: Hsp33 family molecular chaperone HslO [Thermoanaerobaculia bacterium]|nr:Hsp33 family molecular chaperone HslO [Thermoanaerobaculia bacterium]